MNSHEEHVALHLYIDNSDSSSQNELVNNLVKAVEKKHLQIFTIKE